MNIWQSMITISGGGLVGCTFLAALFGFSNAIKLEMKNDADRATKAGMTHFFGGCAMLFLTMIFAALTGFLFWLADTAAC